MVEIYRIEKGAETWKYKAYDYVRTDAFCVGQSIPIELEFSHDEKEEDLQAVILIEDHKPVAGCRIAFPDEKTGKISLDRLDKPDAPEGSSKPRNDKGHGNDRRDRDRKRDNRKPRRRD